MASASFSAGKPGEEAVELARLVERCFRGSGALDLEALCVLPGRKVGTNNTAAWQLWFTKHPSGITYSSTADHENDTKDGTHV